MEGLRLQEVGMCSWLWAKGPLQGGRKDGKTELASQKMVHIQLRAEEQRPAHDQAVTVGTKEMTSPLQEEED